MYSLFMLRIRLTRGGSKKDAHYKIVVIEKTRKRDGRAADIIGHYHPNVHSENRFVIDAGKLDKWIAVGAIPSDVVVRLCLKNGFDVVKKFEVKHVEGANFKKTRKEVKAAASAK